MDSPCTPKHTERSLQIGPMEELSWRMELIILDWAKSQDVEELTEEEKEDIRPEVAVPSGPVCSSNAKSTGRRCNQG